MSENTIKLIRDKIPTLAARRGQHLNTRPAGPDDLVPLLRATVLEEAHEVAGAPPEHVLEEAADVLEAVRALTLAHGYTLDELEAVRADKARERGGFTLGLVLEQAVERFRAEHQAPAAKAMVDRCDTEFVGGGQCTKPASHRPPVSDDPCTPHYTADTITDDALEGLYAERARYRAAWQSARDRAQAYGEGILRIVADRETYQRWLKEAEAAHGKAQARIAELEARDTPTWRARAESAEAAIERVRAEIAPYDWERAEFSVRHILAALDGTAP
ncbi:nucleoside triphosphate pyrophosphohydrolase [Streptomyces bauhiniae]|uniref:Nucleoside triphosphate pyrophosphohydrolase n=1 Tax=Streptomyces bauhiniae TaxID=2340725 RepID=A0A7K3QR84_9ACTN|nr:nucleoside triphosphate pyrophosphohydrolase [Streptomyces bauhiniae]NEB92411.1 nucleoside triphosphate pyrophosphohydrolase [Streptomyces bauhiniae]